MRTLRALLAHLAVSAFGLFPVFAEPALPGTHLVTATSLEGMVCVPDAAFGGQTGFSLEGFPLRRAAATMSLGYLADRDSGGEITPTPYASLLAGWRFPAPGYFSFTPLVGATVDAAVSGYAVDVTPYMTFAVRGSMLLSGRDYLTLTPSLLVPVGSGGNARLSLALGTRREKPWYIPIREVEPALTARPSLFSPDGDGTDDFVVIAPGASAPKSVDRWTITAYASDGSRWRGYEGTGKLPKRIAWDGKSDDGASPDAGEDFSIVLKTYDALGRAAAADATVSVTIDVLVIREGDRYKVRVPNIHFPPDSADLSEAASREFLDDNRATLERIAGLFIKFPDYDLTVEGYANAVHADDPALFAEEQEKELLPLSLRRADTVKRALVLLGVDGERIETRGYGGSRPVVPGSERAGAWKNRRVEFILSR